MSKGSVAMFDVIGVLLVAGGTALATGLDVLPLPSRQ